MTDDPKDDLRQFLPGRDRARELADPAAAEERIARALDKAAALRTETASEPDAARDEHGAAVSNAGGPGCEMPSQEIASTHDESPMAVPIPCVAGADSPAAVVHAAVSVRGPAFRGPKQGASISGDARAGTTSRKRPMSAVVASVLGVLAVAVPVGLSLALWPRVQVGGVDPAIATSASVAMTVGTASSASTKRATPGLGSSVPEVEAAVPSGLSGSSASPSATGAAPASTATGAPPAASWSSKGGSSSVPPKSSARPRISVPAGKSPASALPFDPASVSATASAPPPEPTGPAPRYNDTDF